MIAVRQGQFHIGDDVRLYSSQALLFDTNY